MVNASKSLSDPHTDLHLCNGMDDLFPVCPVVLSQRVRDKNSSVMVTLKHSQQSNTIPPGKKCTITTSKCTTSPVSAADTIVRAQLSNDSPDAQITGERDINENILKYNNKDQFRLMRNAFKGASLAKKIDECELLFFPICHCKHWFLFVVDLQNRLFAFMDSLFSMKSLYQVVVRGLLVGNFKHLWKAIVDPEYSFDDFRILYPNIPRQGNGHDCGVYVMKCMEIWTPGVALHDYFSAVNIPNIRVQYANQLFFSSKNTADKSLVKQFFREGKFQRVRKSITSDSNESKMTRVHMNRSTM
uniref:Uncharacterized protein n=1 Tax=Avena sativa TaxID=4498 RepID=A0ACD5TKR0_AVESA